MLNFFTKHNVRQHSPANIKSYKRLATFTSGVGRVSKRRSKRRGPCTNRLFLFRFTFDKKKKRKSNCFVPFFALHIIKIKSK